MAGAEVMIKVSLSEKPMDMETYALIAVALIMVPFFIYYALWSFAIALIWQLFWLGVKCGLGLMAVCSIFMAVLKFGGKWYPEACKAFGITGAVENEAGEVKVKCTMLDVVLTVMFQAGLRIPPVIWERLMDYFVKTSEAGGEDGEDLSSMDEMTTTEEDNSDVEFGGFGDFNRSPEEEEKNWRDHLFEDQLPSIPVEFVEDGPSRRVLQVAKNRRHARKSN